jgi:hypothetical protein
MPQLALWRAAGTAPVVTPKTFKAATKKLEIIAVPKPSK